MLRSNEGRQAICRGPEEHKRYNGTGVIKIAAVDVVVGGWVGGCMQQPEELHEQHEWMQAWGDVSGTALGPETVRQASMEEIA